VARVAAARRACALALAAALAQVGACSRPAGSSRAEERTSGGEVALRVPAALRIAHALDTLTIDFDPAARAPVVLSVGAGMALGIETTAYVFPAGGARPARGRVLVLPGGDLDRATSTWSTKADGIPQPGTRYVVEMEVTLFETDVPPGPDWNPRAGQFRVLWSRTLRQAEE
jgi:hypothetical protein